MVKNEKNLTQKGHLLSSVLRGEAVNLPLPCFLNPYASYRVDAYLSFYGDGEGGEHTRKHGCEIIV